LKGGDEKTEAAGVIVIAEINAHIAELRAVAAEGHARDHANVGKSAVVVVMVEIIRDGIIGDEKIGPAVVVVIAPLNAEAIIADLIVNAGFLRDFLKRAVAAIVIEKIALAFESPGTALHLKSFVQAKFVAAGGGHVFDVDMDVARNKKVCVAVAIVIAPGCSGAESAAANARFFRDVFELAAAEIVIQNVTAIAGDEEVELAVVIVIGDGHAHAPAAAREAGLLRDVLESAVGLLMIERDHGITAFEVTVDGRAVYVDDVEAAIVIAIEEADAAAHGFDDVALLAGGDVRDGEAERFCHVDEFGDGRKAGTVYSGRRKFCGGRKRDGGALRARELRGSETK
jgi:hypothetical protein